MTDKKIEPTGVMVDEAANILCLDATHESLRFHAGMTQHTYRQRARTVMRAALRAALNRPDAADLLASEWKANAEAAAERAERAEEKLADSVHVDEGDRPWEPLGKDDPLNVGDEVRQDWYGTTTTAIVGRVDGDGDPWTAEGAPIGSLDSGTWYVRRAVEDLPTEDGAVIIPAEGHEFIETNCGMHQFVMILGADGRWHGGAEVVAPEDITPGTWKVAPNA